MKKTQSFLLALVVFLSVCVVLPAKGATPEQDVAANQLVTLGLLTGYDDGSLRLDQNINRAEMTVLLIRLLGQENNTVPGADKKEFADVHAAYWGKPWIQKAAVLGVMIGLPNQTFRPENPITYAETVTLMVRLLKKDQNVVGEWPLNYMARGRELGILPPTLNKQANDYLTRGEVSELIWNTLISKLQ